MSGRYLVVDPMFNETAATDDLSTALKWGASDTDVFVLDQETGDRYDVGVDGRVRLMP